MIQIAKGKEKESRADLYNHPGNHGISGRNQRDKTEPTGGTEKTK